MAPVMKYYYIIYSVFISEFFSEFYPYILWLVVTILAGGMGTSEESNLSWVAIPAVLAGEYESYMNHIWICHGCNFIGNVFTII